ncbi:Fic family protein [Roseibium sp. FZY0029]|uniref:Fic family protein n=1 Tax=Roseibium sp. FZY0029 TaxID=3116647 RepID=UPI002E9C51F9|nr:Fic family protein [Roseibium sp. FZY0029]
MILFDLDPTEYSPNYQALQVSNLKRQYDFLKSIVEASIATNRIYVSQTVLKAFNFHAIVCLHSDAGQFRRCEVNLGTAKDAHEPPMWIYVQALMDDFVNQINTNIATADPVVLASFALWRLNWIHPFINGNGRTARLTAYYILCMRAGGMIKGATTLPELLRRHRGEKADPYVAALKLVDAGYKVGKLDLTPLHNLVSELLSEQLDSEDAPPEDF